MIDDAQYETNLDPLKFKCLLSDAEKLIYPYCTKFTKLSVLLKLYNLKARHEWNENITPKSFASIMRTCNK